MDPQITLQKAIGLFRQGLQFQALEWLSSLLETQPDSGKAWELKGLIEDSLSWHHVSIHSLETATTLIPLSASGQYVLAKNYLETGKTALGSSVFAILLQRDDIPDRLLSAIAAYLDRYSDLTYLALSACRKAVAQDPECGDSLLGMAYFMEKLKYPYQQTAGVLRKAVSLDPENRHYRMALSNILVQSGEIQEAWKTAREISRAELKQIQCSSCLNKLIDIFTEVEDHNRRDYCLSLLQQLPSTDTPNNRNPLPDSIPSPYKFLKR
ncbi:tetratricopeptide repeat protein [Gimesia sp.]|uniref:tetratricopeptide repeat protein n=1 Tax=Gimesia sp. TaxID=2024833 RepID=UPI003A950E5D